MKLQGEQGNGSEWEGSLHFSRKWGHMHRLVALVKLLWLPVCTLCEGQGFLSAESRLGILLLVTQKEKPLLVVAEVGAGVAL